MGSSETGKWLEKTLVELCSRMENGLWLDHEVISGVVSYCEFAPPHDAREYLNNIIGEETVRPVVEEYMQRRNVNPGNGSNDLKSNLKTYMKPPADEVTVGTKKQTKVSKVGISISNQEGKQVSETTEPQSCQKSMPNVSRKKKSGKVVSLADAAKGSIVQGKPCACQARRHKLVSNCLSCGKIVCEQEGEGPCSFCGALVLREGSTYAGLEADDTVVPLSESEVAAEAFKKRLVEYDRNSAARTTVIDDQSDYYEIEGNSWLSIEEKKLLQKQQEEIEEAERARRSKVVVTFDLVGRKVLMHKDEMGSGSENSLLRSSEPVEEREINRIKPNPNIGLCPIFVDPGPLRGSGRDKHTVRRSNGLCLEISGRVQHDSIELPKLFTDGLESQSSYKNSWQSPKVSYIGDEDSGAC